MILDRIEMFRGGKTTGVIVYDKTKDEEVPGQPKYKHVTSEWVQEKVDPVAGTHDGHDGRRL